MSEESDARQAPQYWFNTATGEVEEGHQSGWTSLMGPYATREEAAHALDKARRRTKAWDDDEDRWRTGSADAPD